MDLHPLRSLTAVDHTGNGPAITEQIAVLFFCQFSPPRLANSRSARTTESFFSSFRRPRLL